MLAVRGKDEAGRSVDLTCRNGCARWSALRAAVDENLTTRGTASRARTGYAARVARRMVDMLRSQLPANSCDVAPCARPLGRCQGKGTDHVLPLELGAVPTFGGAGAD